MMVDDPCLLRVQEDLQDPDMVYGCEAARWRVISLDFPTLYFAISATEPGGERSEYAFKADLSNYRAQAPHVQIWDLASGHLLAPDKRPKGGNRVKEAFKKWGSETVYRPWERATGAHNNNASRYPHLAWHPDRHIMFIFEDLHGILNSNARKNRIQVSS